MNALQETEGEDDEGFPLTAEDLRNVFKVVGAGRASLIQVQCRGKRVTMLMIQVYSVLKCNANAMQCNAGLSCPDMII